MNHIKKLLLGTLILVGLQFGVAGCVGYVDGDRGGGWYHDGGWMDGGGHWGGGMEVHPGGWRR